MAETPQSPDAAPTHFGKYLLDREIARGGMSRVFRARLRGPGGFEKKLVVKQILPELARDPSFIELFVKEANTLVQMSHPSLVPVYELGVVDGVYFLAMEWIEGATILEILREGPLPAAQVAQIGAEIAEALRYAHERFQIVHRDVTPRNVIVDGAGHARLLDFGIAAPVELTGQGELFGSPGYMAPEQLRGESLGPQSDLFSLGAVLYEAASGRPALPRHTSKLQLPYSAVPPLSELHPTLSELFASMLDSERERRPQQAAQVASALRTWLAEHHPRGVEQELAVRAQRAHDTRQDEPVQAPRPGESQTSPISGRVEVRSIAQSAALHQLLELATERIERDPSPAPAAIGGQSSATEELAADPEAVVTIRRFGRDTFIVFSALFLGILWAQYRPLQQQPLDETVSQEAKAWAKLKPNKEGVDLRLAAQSAVQPPTAASSATPTVAPAAAPVATPPSAASVEAPNAKPDASKSAFVTINAIPWAEVRIDGRLLGVTPRRRVPLRPGKHSLLFACPPLGHEAKVPLELRPNQELQVLVDLQSDPAKVSLR